MCVKVLSVVYFLVSSLNALPDFARSLWRVAKGNMSNGAHTARPHAERSVVERSVGGSELEAALCKRRAGAKALMRARCVGDA